MKLKADDPLAQTFFVSKDGHNFGIFVPSVYIYFKTKDDEGLPVTLQLRKTINGVPGPEILPYAEKTLTPDNVNVTATGPNSDSSVSSLTATTFTFSSPVYLAPAEEYAIVLKSPSDQYQAWVGEMGEVREDVTGTRRITQQPYVGSLFLSQNDKTWTASQWEDLAFVMKKCKFTTTGTNYAYFANPASTPSSTYRFDTFRLGTEDNIDSVSTHTQWQMRSRKRATAAESSGTADSPSTSTYTNIRPNETIDITDGQRAVHTTAGSLVLKADFTSHNEDVSPAIDASRLQFVAVENLVNNFTTNETNAFATQPDGATAPQDSSSGGPRARYISRKVTLADGFDAQDLQVFLTADKPPSATITVYAKVLAAEDETNFDDVAWTLMSQKTNSSNTSKYNSGEYKEYEYQPTTSPLTYTGVNNVIYKTFKQFAIKVVMTSSDSNYVPKFRDLRVIALDSGRTGLVSFGLE